VKKEEVKTGHYSYYHLARKFWKTEWNALERKEGHCPNCSQLGLWLSDLNLWYCWAFERRWGTPVSVAFALHLGGCGGWDSPWIYKSFCSVVVLSWLTGQCIAQTLGTTCLDWTVGVVIPRLKKGDPRVCDNYQGITLLSLLHSLLLLLSPCKHDRHNKFDLFSVGNRIKIGCQKLFVIFMDRIFKALSGWGIHLACKSNNHIFYFLLVMLSSGSITRGLLLLICSIFSSVMWLECESQRPWFFLGKGWFDPFK